jgi:rhodanese-related sulfurtransferase
VRNRFDPFGGVPQVDAATAHEQEQSGEAAILDVREPEEWQLGHIEAATWIPLDQLPARWQELDRDTKWVVVCLAGTRSNYASAFLRGQGLDASNLAGGMLEWQRRRLPITPPGIVAPH